ncbi:tRNA (adenosine(37)-N6)-threonylcarbamoyltransferase complex transferase subunit TsaD [Pelagibacteraceae bacterium]|jgi:N6-L-threonylcarbamoyladenine synthase|nr:tRNA (adenosine(37)-N6)-threonylcarbamoyltransferase complex transferase subunit TsaD [Pelagibacteraceae bacterium]
MKKKLTFLGIETSCDETAAAVIQENDNGTANILSSIVSSQIEEHEKFGGVVPELAARSHLENIDFIINEALIKSGLPLSGIDGVAATAGPGLMVCLTIGLNIGKSIAAFTDKPFIAVNHLEGHALSPGLKNKIKFPYLLLLISGGHSQYLIVKGVNEYEQLGTTIDDALGEAFDKTAKMLDLGYPGGPNVEKFSKLGDKKFYKLPEPIINRAGCNLSFAGLKTAVLRESKKINSEIKLKYNLAASFQYTVNKILFKKTKVAMEQFLNKVKVDNPDFIVAGGVAANNSIRENLISVSEKMKFNPMFPDLKFCGDNAAMIAWAGIKRFNKKLINNIDFPAKSRWPLDSSAPYMKGPGLKL